MLFTVEWPSSANSSATQLLFLNDDDLGLIADRSVLTPPPPPHSFLS
jgi:hypothetical protein